METERDRKRPSGDLYRELFDHSADAILIIEGNHFVDCNDATVKMLGFSNKAEVLQTHPSELSPSIQPDGRESFEKANEMIALAFEKGSHRFEWNHKRSDGQVFPVEVLLTAIQGQGRRTLHVVWRDITERRLIEDELRQAQKMEAIGKLTGGIAHDFNNFLVAVIGHADLLSVLVEDIPQAEEHIREIRHAGERAADLVRQLLAFGRKQQLLLDVIDLNTLIGYMEKLLRSLIGEDVLLEVQLCSEPLLIRADRSQLEQVLLNLCANARDAMSTGGKLRIETSLRQPDQASCKVDLFAGECAYLGVSDTGRGMDASIASRAFEPFFTTKAPGKGSGFGLATVHGIVNQSGGRVTLESSAGSGTRIDIWLPLVQGQVAKSEIQSEATSRGFSGAETILVVEDDAAVSRLVQSALERQGYQVLVCSDGQEAFDVYLENREAIGLIISDVTMPKVSGTELFTRLRKVGPAPPIIFISGYTDQSLSGLREQEGDFELLRKPFGIGELLRLTRRTLDAR